MWLGRTRQPTEIGRWANLLLETLNEPDGLRALETVLRYLAHVRDDDDDFIDVLVRATDDEEVEAIAMSYRDRIFNQGREEGREQGREGARRILSKLLQLKFGELERSVEERLAKASLAQLETWSERVLTAETIDAVFAS